MHVNTSCVCSRHLVAAVSPPRRKRTQLCVYSWHRRHVQHLPASLTCQAEVHLASPSTQSSANTHGQDALHTTCIVPKHFQTSLPQYPSTMRQVLVATKMWSCRWHRCLLQLTTILLLPHHVNADGTDAMCSTFQHPTEMHGLPGQPIGQPFNPVYFHSTGIIQTHPL